MRVSKKLEICIVLSILMLILGGVLLDIFGKDAQATGAVLLSAGSFGTIFGTIGRACTK